MAISFCGRPVLDPKQLYRIAAEKGLPTAHFIGKANLYENPVGRGPGRGAVLMRQGDYQTVSDPLTPDDQKAKADGALTFFDGNFAPVVFYGMTMEYAEAILPGAKEDLDGIYLCHFVDRRLHIGRWNADKSYNLRDPATGAYIVSTLKTAEPPTPWTWAELVEDLWEQVGTDELGPFNPLPFVPEGTPGGWEFYQTSAWDALNDVVERLGCVIVYNGNSRFEFVRAGSDNPPFTKNEAEEVEATSPRVWDSYTSQTVRYYPAKIRVLFRKSPLPPFGESPYHAVDVVTSPPRPFDAYTGSILTIYDDMYATPAGIVALEPANRAIERAADWERMRRNYATGRILMVMGWKEKVPGAMGYNFGGFTFKDVGKGFQTELDPGQILYYYPPGIDRTGGGGDAIPGLIVRSSEDGTEVGGFIQKADFLDGEAITFKVLPFPPREPFVDGGYYLAVKLGDEYYAESGPLTKCVEVLAAGTTGALNCDTGQITFSNFTKIRVIEKACP